MREKANPEPQLLQAGPVLLKRMHLAAVEFLALCRVALSSNPPANEPQDSTRNPDKRDPEITIITHCKSSALSATEGLCSGRKGLRAQAALTLGLQVQDSRLSETEASTA